MEYFGLGFVCLLLGILIGKFLEEARWRRNADDIVRIYSKGKLYKVHYDSPSPNKSNQPNSGAV